MSNIVEEIKNQIDKIIRDAFEKADLECEFCEGYIIEKPHEKVHGDFSANIAMQLARPAKKAPRAIAEVLVSNMDLDTSYIEKAEIAGPGFINFFLNGNQREVILKAICKEGAGYGKSIVKKCQKIMLEFVSANPTGPMHMGNARGGALGDSLAAVLEWTGADVTREFYLNDAGAQIVKLGKSLEARYQQHFKGEDAVTFPEDGYHGKDITEHMETFIAETGDKYLNVSEDERKKVIVDYVLKKNIAALHKDLAAYKINYDVWFPESDLYKSGEVEETIDQLKKSGYTYEHDGALWFKSTEFGLEKDDVLVRNTGIPTYFAVDIAYHRNKFIIRGFDKVINVWGADHHGHVARMKGAMQALGVNPERLHVVLMQLVRLMQDGEIVRISKRTGNMITLNDLIDEIGLEPTRFFFNLRQADSHLEFDLDLAKSQTNENPVFYVQYAHARICSILHIMETEGVALRSADEINFTLLKEHEEIELIDKLGDFPEEILAAAEHYDPSRLTRYALDLASMFHSFYNSCRVKCEDEALMQARIALVSAVKTVLASDLSILGINAPERM
ncbi:MAG: arginine--tRNA ligase [Bacillota bacterium]|nr:arginine--tRNA ligase [Bacillota bacterium]